MDQTHDYEISCERYLLGELSEQEQTQLEEQYFEDDALFERFLAVKDDLVDAYARGQLSPEKRQHFEAHFLATKRRRQRIEDARQLIGAITSASVDATGAPSPAVPAGESSWWRSVSEWIGLPPLVIQAALAAFLLVALAGAWVWIRTFRVSQAERARVQDERTPPGQGVEQPANSPINVTTPDVAKDETANRASPPANSITSASRETNNRSPSRLAAAQVASLTLVPFAARDSSSSNSLLITPHTRSVQLRLTFKGDDYRQYEVNLRTVDGEQVTRRRGLNATSNATGKRLTVTLDPSIFRRQDYILTLSGLQVDGMLEAVGDYYFRVDRNASR
ncbi:MAG: hypothetical protein ACR2LM_03320 [Pyrinomonadaceae bacterium]